MKYAFVSFSCQELILEDVLAAASRYGYAGFEPRVGCGHRHGIELEASGAERQRIREAASRSGIELCCLGTSCEYIDPATAQEQIELTCRYIDLACDVGASLVKVFCGELPLGRTVRESLHVVAASLREIAPYAASKGIKVVVETHDHWSDPSDMADLMRLVDHASIKVLWDVMHTQREGFTAMEEAYRIVEPWLAHVHIHDGLTTLDRLQLLPIGTGDFDHFKLLQLLQEGGYEGYLSGEWVEWEPYDIHLPRELAAMRQLEARLIGSKP
ncbi:sugar phosphate isomerase/epimerase family protein [Paenibacillus sp. GCM10027626]|uniref:sugar phosphate isomerase/epimerase family protein n=1 Tax=Paenibacillus sp. GCM10027626 TaxID=3273411 RepID=UPI00362B9D97